ncbi:mitogen-activated protein kinase kinase kinase 13-A, partial [Trifolium medium]|nr:mitogen-activated protein kinase kinase kinase 13-A [Trifolium medium]
HFPDNYQVGFLTDAIKLPQDQILRLCMPLSLLVHAILMEQYSQKDLHHMIEEYEELERAGGSQRLRIFLIPSNEPESPSSNESRVNQQSDVDYHYVVAVNGILDRSPRKNHGGLSLASHTSQFANTSDYNNPHFHRESSTYAFASEVKDCNPTSSNLADIMSKPA